MKITCCSYLPSVALATLITFGLTGAAAAQGVPGSLSVIKCDAVRIQAAGDCTFGAFSCYAKHAKKPLKDPGSLTLAVCLAKWGEKAATEFDDAGDTAAKTGGGCSYNGSSDDLIGSIGLFAKTLTDAITDGVDMEDRVDNRFRSILIKESGRYTDAILAAESANILHPDAGKLAGALAKAKNRFLKKTSKAVKKATKAGIDYRGPGPAELAMIVEDFAASTVDTLN